MDLSRHLPVDNVVLDLAASSKAVLIAKLAALAAERLSIEAGAIEAALLKREELGSTGIGEGVAVPHSYLPNIDAPFCMFARLRKPIDFQSLDDRPVDLVFLFLKAAREDTGLNLLACIARRVRNEDTARHLRSVSKTVGVHHLLCSEDAQEKTP